MDTTPPPDGTLRLIIRDELTKALKDHSGSCPLVSLGIEERTRKLETKIATIWGYAVGSGLVAGATGAALTRFLP